MKADEPGSRVVKYGMGAEDQHRLVERHFQVARERALLEGGTFARGLHRLPALKAALDGIGAKQEPAPPPVVSTIRDAAPAPLSLREQLGLT